MSITSMNTRYRSSETFISFLIGRTCFVILAFYNEGWQKGIELAVVLAFAFLLPGAAQDQGSQGCHTCLIITGFRWRLCPRLRLTFSSID